MNGLWYIWGVKLIECSDGLLGKLERKRFGIKEVQNNHLGSDQLSLPEIHN